MRIAKLSLCAFFTAASLASLAGAATVANPSFETGSPVIGGSLNLNWSGDVHGFVTAENGITPLAGNRMLKFINSSSSGPSSANVCDVIQIVDFSSAPDQAVITAGGASVIASAFFNRVRDLVQPNVVDTRFALTVRSHSSYSNAVSLAATNVFTANLLSDANLNTWEALSSSITLPTNTLYVTIHLAAVENVVNDTAGVEFHGHYADEVGIQLIPTPGTVSLAGLAGLVAMRRRRHTVAA